MRWGTADKVPSHGYLWITGAVLVLFGVSSILLTFLRYRRTERPLRSNSYQPNSWLPNVLTGAIAAIIIVLVAYLIQSKYR